MGEKNLKKSLKTSLENSKAKSIITTEKMSMDKFGDQLFIQYWKATREDICEQMDQLAITKNAAWDHYNALEEKYMKLNKQTHWLQEIIDILASQEAEAE